MFSPNVAQIDSPKLAMRVRLRMERVVTAFGKPHVLSEGLLGTIDYVHDENKNLFWVATDEGGFFGWTTLDVWAFTGEYAEVSEEWLQLRVSRK